MGDPAESKSGPSGLAGTHSSGARHVEGFRTPWPGFYTRVLLLELREMGGAPGPALGHPLAHRVCVCVCVCVCVQVLPARLECPSLCGTARPLLFTGPAETQAKGPSPATSSRLGLQVRPPGLRRLGVIA